MNSSSSFDIFPGKASASASGCLAVTADLHLHTHHSHGQASTEAMFQAARAKGLTIIGFSEHSPRPQGYSYPSDYQEKLSGRFPTYVEEVRRAADSGKPDGITVLLGLEVDYIPGREAYAKSLIHAYDFDYIIGGLHYQDTWGFDFTADDWKSMEREARFAAYARYYQDLAAMCRSGLFHIAAHPDLVKIFTVEWFHEWLKDDAASALVKEALTAMKDHGMIMEVSSAGLRKPCKEIYPCPRIMAMAAELRLPISFGSDAHCVNTPAFGFDVLARYAREYGYSCSSVPVRGQIQSISF